MLKEKCKIWKLSINKIFCLHCLVKFGLKSQSCLFKLKS